MIISHRGDARVAAENTLPAFAAALAAGVAGIELDVHCTRDGAVVVHHDPIPRARPADARLTGRPFLTLDRTQVASFRHEDGTSLPTLPEVLDLIGDRATVYCELKGAGVVEHAAPLLARHRGPCAMHAGDHRAVLTAAALAPAVPRGILVVSRLVDTLAALRAAQASTLWPHAEYIDAELVAELHRAGMQAIAWTVNAPAQARALAAFGTDGLCTDTPDHIQQALASTERGAGA
jgi:glycerophosphoryl diester phosphodiesterase